MSTVIFPEAMRRPSCIRSDLCVEVVMTGSSALSEGVSVVAAVSSMPVAGVVILAAGWLLVSVIADTGGVGVTCLATFATGGASVAAGVVALTGGN